MKLTLPRLPWSKPSSSHSANLTGTSEAEKLAEGHPATGDVPPIETRPVRKSQITVRRRPDVPTDTPSD